MEYLPILGFHRISSMKPQRGFSFRSDAVLDMRMNRESEKTAQTSCKYL